MRRTSALAVAALGMTFLALLPGVAIAQPENTASDARGRPTFSPGAPGIGDPYFPLDGNGGYDVRHYDLDVTYDPETDVLSGTATIRARATQNLSAFNLDFAGLNVRSVHVDGRPADWSRDGDELTVTPTRGLRDRTRFTTVIRYDGIPETLPDGSGFIHTDDGALVVGQPAVADTWFPVNDHPLDKASFTIVITAPTGLEAVSNGILRGTRERRGWTTWTWDAREPMAPYLSMMAIGEFDLRAYRNSGIRYWDALDPDLFVPFAAPRTGDQFALSQVGQPAYKRLARTISVPSEGAQLSFWVARDTEPGWDFMFVEAHPVGSDTWTTLPDVNGHTTQDTGSSCPYWLGLHPFLEHYQTDNGDDTCSPKGTTGDWYAASGTSDGYEEWVVDLSAYAGSDVEVSISYVSDESVQLSGVFVDDVVVSVGEGSTSFEEDGDTLDGWTFPGAPEGSPPNPNDWIVGTVEDVPATVGEIAEGSLARQPEIIDFLSDIAGRYPFSAAGGVVDDAELGFALETQTRPIYATGFFSDSVSGNSVVVHELAHQWFGDSLAVEGWQHIWLNEGFATYMEWLWSEREGLGTVQEQFDFWYGFFPEDDPFWSVVVGDPGPENLFAFAVYQRGAMTLHQLRLAIGDDDFFRLIRRWVRSYEGGNVATDDFIALAERVSGQQLDDLFETWLFTPSRPELSDAAAAARVAVPSRNGVFVGELLDRMQRAGAGH
jgi:hypothetical protein